MASEQRLITELVRAKMINAKREKESAFDPVADNPIYRQWEGQEMMAQQILGILEGK